MNSRTTVVLLYQPRWQVELFFRWFKSFANFGHLISQSCEWFLAHLYLNIIAVMLTYLQSGYRPSKYMFALLSQVADGAATLDEILPLLRERERCQALDCLSAAKRHSQKRATEEQYGHTPSGFPPLPPAPIVKPRDATTHESLSRRSSSPAIQQNCDAFQKYRTTLGTANVIKKTSSIRSYVMKIRRLRSHFGRIVVFLI